jgi:hypothetical protein
VKPVPGKLKPVVCIVLLPLDRSQLVMGSGESGGHCRATLLEFPKVAPNVSLCLWTCPVYLRPQKKVIMHLVCADN